LYRYAEEFCFLFGGEGEDYYRWLKYATKAGINPDAPPGADAGFDPVALAEAARKIAEAVAAAGTGAPAAAAAPPPPPVTQAKAWWGCTRRIQIA
jgi:hypothetical protein